MSYSVAPHLNPTASTVPQASKHVEPAKSVELAGSGVTSVFPDRFTSRVRDRRGPNWLSGFVYWLRRKEKGNAGPLHHAASCFTRIWVKTLLA